MKQGREPQRIGEAPRLSPWTITEMCNSVNGFKRPKKKWAAGRRT